MKTRHISFESHSNSRALVYFAMGVALVILFFIAPAWGQGVGCYESARATTTLDTATALRLCCNKNVSAPVACFNRARAETTMSDDDALALCTCATTTRPVDCFNAAAAQTTLDTSDTLGVCARDPERGFVPNAGSPLNLNNAKSFGQTSTAAPTTGAVTGP